MATKSPAPTGLEIKRNNNKFTLTWSIPSTKYGDGQHFAYKKKTETTDKWVSADVSKTATSKSISIDKADYYPNSGKPKLLAIYMRVQGNRNADKDKYDWSDWKEKKFDIDPPLKPSGSFALSNVGNYTGVFSWQFEVSTTGQRIFTRVLWESILIEDCNTKTGGDVASLFKSSTLGWQTGTSTSADSSKTITENSALFNKSVYSYTRWFRIKAQGPNGDSAWLYLRHVYATPDYPRNVSVRCTLERSVEYLIAASWESPASVAHPIDYTEVQYTKQIPADANLSCPSSGVDWNVGKTIKDTKDEDGASFTTTDLLGLDECLYVKVQNFYGSDSKSSSIVLARVGNLKDPTNLSVVATASSHTITISANNNSEASASKLAVVFEYGSGSRINRSIIGVLEDSNSHILYCPDWGTSENVTVSVYAFIGTATYTTNGNIRTYTINAKMRSTGTLYFNITGSVPVAPTGISLDKTSVDGTIKVSWTWGAGTTGVELSWADHADAWESTDPPETYEVSAVNSPTWNISGLELGRTWYVKLRFYSGSGDDKVYGDYTTIQSIDLLSAPNVPALQISPAIVTTNGEITASWVYVSTDSTPQSYAELAIESNGSISEPFIHTLTDQHITFRPADFNGQAGNTYNIVLRVKSESGKFSEWSNRQPVIVANPLSCQIALDTSAGSCWAIEEIVDDPDQPLVTRSVLSLKDMPMVIGVTGSSTAVTTTVIVERAADFILKQPNNRDMSVAQGETICVKQSTTADPIQIRTTDLVGMLNDGASYNILAMVQDSLGQVAEATPVRFEVHWTHQVGLPTAKIEIDKSNLIAKITPKAFAGAISTDYCDIYRLSVDTPELIYHQAAFGTTYVDPYPTLGPMGGYRIVACTANGDYIADSGVIAWYDTSEHNGPTVENPDDLNIIDFELGQIRFYYNTDLAGGWTKNFTKVQYLDGKTVGYWNPGADHERTMKTLVITTLDQAMIQLIHQLAVYDGPCHIRTSDGTSFTANIEVPDEDNTHEDLGMRLSYSLKIEQVDSEGFDAVTLAQWNAMQ